MKRTLKNVWKSLSRVNGNSLAEFATVSALMATLAATAAPKLSEMSEGTKAEKSGNEIDKILKQAQSFYQATADTEGRGRFPGQEKFNCQVGYHLGGGSRTEIDLNASLQSQSDESKNIDNNLCKSCFIIDARIHDIWTNTVSYLLYKKRDEDSTFYQTEFENLLNFFNGNSFNKDTYKKIISTIS